MLKDSLVSIIRELNESPDSNTEYIRGQLELAMYLTGYEDDGYFQKLELVTLAFPDSPLSARKSAL